MKRSVSLIALYITTLIPSVHAQLANQVEAQQRQIEQRQAAQLRKIQENVDSSNRTAPPTSLQPKAQDLEKIFKDSPSLFFKQVKLKGHTKLKQPFLKRLHAKYDNQNLTLESVRNIIREITNEYVSMGYITCRAYLPPQDITSGILNIAIIEGTLESYSTEKDKNPVNTKNAMPNSLGSVVNLRDIEQGFEQINRLQSNKATMDVQPGSTTGTSNIFIKNTNDKLWHLNFDLNNYGLESTGKYQLFTTLSYDNLFKINDLITLTHGADPTLSNDGSFNQLGSLVFSVPYGYWLFKAAVNASEYKNYQTNNQIEIRSNGRTKGLSLDADWLFYRDQRTKMNFTIGFQYKNAKNFINEKLLEVSSRQTSSVSLGISALTILNNGNSQAYFKATYTHGTPFFGGQAEPFLDGPNPRFHKFSLYGSYTTGFKLNQRPYGSSTSFNVQYAPQQMFSSEQINLGGQSTIRGYRNDSISSDSGFYLRHELNSPMPNAKIAGINLDLVQPYISCDAGLLFGPEKGEHSELISGLSIGTRIRYKNWNADLSVSIPVTAPDVITERKPLWGISLSSSF